MQRSRQTQRKIVRKKEKGIGCWDRETGGIEASGTEIEG